MNEGRCIIFTVDPSTRGDRTTEQAIFLVLITRGFLLLRTEHGTAPPNITNYTWLYLRTIEGDRLTTVRKHAECVCAFSSQEHLAWLHKLVIPRLTFFPYKFDRSISRKFNHRLRWHSFIYDLVPLDIQWIILVECSWVLNQGEEGKMSMLAEPRRKQKWTLNPRGKQWSEGTRLNVSRWYLDYVCFISRTNFPLFLQIRTNSGRKC